MQKNKRELINETTEFIKLLNLQYSFLSKLKRDDKNGDGLFVFREFK